MTKYYYNLGSCFSDTAKRHGADIALRYADSQHSYADLLIWVEKLASLLLAGKLERGDVIAIGNSKGPLTYALMLAALRLGVVYVNLDVASPLSRNLRIAKLSGAKHIFHDDPEYSKAMAELASNCDCSASLLDFDILPKVTSADRELQQNLMQKVDGATIAYVMFTSGSTGEPKGVAVTHQNVLHFISWGVERFQIDNQDNFANISPMYFDNSVFDFYVGLFSGASLTPVSRELLTSPYDLVTHVGNMGCTIWFSVPSMLIYLMAMKAMTPTALPGLRRIIFGGEGYPKAELKKLFDLFHEQAVLVNVYGPTECTCICSAYDISNRDFKDLDGLPPLGELNQNFDYCILDDEDEDADVGELCLIGPNVAAGYFNDPERTAASFHTLSSSRFFMKHMYRTGDIVRESEGMLYFSGRKDNQIKHMGYRIELEEIEHALAKLPGVHQSAVVYHRANVAYGKLIGFIASSDEVDEKDLKAKLGSLLPEYMIPSTIIVKSELPKNANGKVDRQTLAKLI
ncbi:AMP-binding protein [uncultured Sneathiella sp.]|uniref:AMP-binding protein n=1 Tax=uncultured Sneathiella sp. TaxID=879315 RepID=UPI0030EE737D|tara:strand:+ start:18844 stop:20388 length:1545 start_codon:yes stop_codon:yes gene_type:complete